MIKATVIRTDAKAEQYGEIAFTADFRFASDEQIERYMRSLAEGCATVGSFRIDIGLA